jgi:hypothetical protein
MLLKTRLWLLMISSGLLCACHKKDVQLGTLQTSKMTEADSTGLYTNTDSSILLECVEAFIIPKGTTEAGSIPLANLYKCVNRTKDTVLLIDLDRHIIDLDPVKDILGIEVKPSRKFDACRINIDSASVSRFRTYKYKYSTLTYVIED